MLHLQKLKQHVVFCVETSVKNYFSSPVHWVLSPWTPPAAHLAVLQIILPSDHPTLTSYLSHLAEWWKPDPSSSQSAPGKAPGACPSSQIWRTAPPAGPLTPVGSGSSHTGPTQREKAQWSWSCSVAPISWLSHCVVLKVYLMIPGCGPLFPAAAWMCSQETIITVYNNYHQAQFTSECLSTCTS